MIIDRKGIEELLPQRDPFLFVDEITELEEGKRIVATYTFPPEADFFRGHFPGRPLVPGVLLVEAMAQAGGVLAYKTVGFTYKEKGAMLLRLDKVVFRRPVVPGEKLIMKVQLVHRRDPVSRLKGKISVGDKLCAEATIMATFTELECTIGKK